MEFGIFVFVQVHLSLDGWMVSSELGAVLKTKNLAGFHGASFLLMYNMYLDINDMNIFIYTHVRICDVYIDV